MARAARVLVVDDDRAVRAALRVNLTKAGYEVVLAEDVPSATLALHGGEFDVVLTDVQMPGGTGLDLLAKVRQAWPDTQVIVMTGYGSVADAVSAMRAGAADYLIKPVGKDEMLVVIHRCIEQRALRTELVALRREVGERFGFQNIIGNAHSMKKLYDDIDTIADASATVLIEGPTGTGKELLAHALHTRSRRSQGPYIRLNCGAVPESLLESELFGHEKGSFTGATRQHLGRFEQADGGTLLLDEIGEVGHAMQVRLLRVLENGEIQRVGGTGQVRVDVRVVAATHRTLQTEVREGRFREDLYYRLNVVTLKVPALRERREDIPLLVDHFVRLYATRNQRTVQPPSAEDLRRLVAYDWPGNVRELEHTIERAVILSRDGRLDLRLAESVVPAKEVAAPPSVLPPPGVSLQDALLAHERAVLIAALEEAGGVQTVAAKRLGLSKSNLSYRLSRLGIRQTSVSYD